MKTYNETNEPIFSIEADSSEINFTNDEVKPWALTFESVNLGEEEMKAFVNFGFLQSALAADLAKGDTARDVEEFKDVGKNSELVINFNMQEVVERMIENDVVYNETTSEMEDFVPIAKKTKYDALREQLISMVKMIDEVQFK